MRFGNGFGSVYKLSGNRRNPWAVRKTVGWKDNGQPEYFFVGFYRTRTEALNALMAYNANPNEKAVNLTFIEVYEKWSDDKYPKLSNSGVTSYKAAVKILAPLYDVRFADIKLADVQKVVDESGKNTPTLKNVKNIIGMIYDYAVVNEIVPPDKREFMRYLDISKAGNPRKIERENFSADQIGKLWEHQESFSAQTALILIYSGLRIGELLELEKKNVDLDKRVMHIVKSKTAAGVRDVPISKKTLPFIARMMEQKGKRLVGGSGLKYRTYYDTMWADVQHMTRSDHKPHDTRHTFVSMLTDAGADPRVIRAVVGHSTGDVTEDVYTHVSLEKKIEAVDLL